MSLTRNRGIACVLLALVLSAPAYARAQAACPRREAPAGPSAGVLLGYGYAFVQGLQGLKLGVGASAGYTFARPSFYLGATALAHFGSSERARFAGGRYTNERHDQALSLDAGYDVVLGRRFLLRVLLATGVLVDRATTTVGTASLASRDVYGFLGPAGVLFFELGALRAGFDLRIPVFPGALLSQSMLLGYARLDYRFR